MAVGIVIAIVLGLVVGGLAGYYYQQKRAAAELDSAETQAKSVVEEARRLAETTRRAGELEARDEAIRIRQSAEAEAARLRQEIEGEVKTRLADAERREERLLRREEGADAKTAMLDRKELSLEERDHELDATRRQLDSSAEEHRKRLEQIAGMSSAEARANLVHQIEDDAKREAMGVVRDIEQQAREEGERRARKIVTIAIQRVASEQTSESTVAVLPLPSDEMKGRIIGREGRNIRAFEAVTGVDVIIDDTPDAVVFPASTRCAARSARLALEKLVADGRIHPARIEEVVERARR